MARQRGVNAVTRQDTIVTRLEGGHTTRHPERGVREAWTQRACSQDPLGAPCAPNPILTQDTVLSHYLDHCSWTMFTGFMGYLSCISL